MQALESGLTMYPYAVSAMIPNFAFALGEFSAGVVEESLPHLKGDLPTFGQFDFAVGSDDEASIVAMRFKGSGLPRGGRMVDKEFNQLKLLAGPARICAELSIKPELREYFGWDRFLLVLDVVNGEVDWHVAQREMLAWLADAPLDRAQLLNTRRVQSAIPRPPQYCLSRMQAAMWVLECEDSNTQGTAFDLDPYGVVTNEHVVRGATGMIAFRALEPTIRYSIRVLSENSALDLAIIEVVDAARPGPLLPDSSDVPHMAHVAVCGFPNFRVGDSGVLTPGLIIGSRPKSGVRRLLTNAPIVAGMSGGPAVGESGEVIGICVTGSTTYREAGETEDHSIVPVSALNILGAT